MLTISGRQLTVAAGSKTPQSKQGRKELSACQDLKIFCLLLYNVFGIWNCFHGKIEVLFSP